MVDPNQKLPPELFTETFSLLSTPQFALSSGVSRGWRSDIVRSTTINRILDLTGLKIPLTEVDLIKLVNRLASLSDQPRNEVHLDLSKFFSDSFFPASESEGFQHLSYGEMLGSLYRVTSLF